MQKQLVVATALFTLLIVAIVAGANADVLPRPLKQLANFLGGDKTGHFILFGILTYLVNKSALVLLPKGNPTRLILTVSLLLSCMISLEEWSQALFPARTMSFSDLLASLSGVVVFAFLVYWNNR